MTTDNRVHKWARGQKAGITGLLAVWFAAAYFIGSEKLLVGDEPGLFAPIALTAVIPVALFLGLYLISPRVRGFVLAQDIRTLTMIHLWRVIGFNFLLLYAYDLLPAMFAFPAGAGDVAIGILALAVVARIDRDPDYVTSKGLVRFHLLGLLDFAVAVATASLTSGVFPALIADGVTSAPTEIWPLNIFPSFLVPIFIILHLVVLLKVRDLRRTARTHAHAALQPA